MLYYCARSNVVSDHRFFKQKPNIHVDYNMQAQQIDITFWPQPNDEPICIWNFELLFPELEVKKGTCSLFDISASSNFETVGEQKAFVVKLIEREVKL